MKKKKLIIFGLIIVLLVGTVAAVIHFFDLNRLKPFIRQTVKDYTGRDLAINGDIRLHSIWPPNLSVEEVAFQNAPWGSRPEMMRVKRAECTVSLKPLLRGEFRFFRIRLEEIAVLLETNQEGISNFMLGTSDTEDETDMPAMAFNDILIQKGYFEYKDAKLDLNAAVHVDALKADIPGLDKPVQINFQGRFRELPFSLDGSIGPVIAWIRPGYNLPIDLSARLGNGTARLKGDIRDPFYLKDISLGIAADGPSTREMANLIDWGSIPDFGAFTVTAELTDRHGPISLETLAVNIGSRDQASFSATGRIGDLLEIKGFDVNLDMHAHSLGHLMHLAELPEPPFDASLAASAHFSDTAENQYSMDDLVVRLGEQTIQGRVGLDITRPRAVLDLQLQSEHAELGPLALKTRMSGSADQVRVDHMELQMGRDNLFRAHITGAADSLSPLKDLDLNFRVSGKDLANLHKIRGQPVPVRGPYVLSGTIRGADHRSLQLPDLKIILGQNSINGSLGFDMEHTYPRLRGSLAADRLNLERLLKPGTLPGNLQEQLSSVGPTRAVFQVSGPMDHPVLDSIDMRTRVKDLADLRITGSMKDPLALTGADLHISLKGSDLANLRKVADRDIPLKGPFALSCRMHNPDSETFYIENLNMAAGADTFNGRSVIRFSGSDTVATLELGTKKATLQALVAGYNPVLDRLKSKEDLGPCEIQATAILSAKGQHLENLDLAIGRNDFIRTRVKGSVGNLAGFQDLQLDFQVSSRDVSNLETIAGKTIPLKGPFALSGEVAGHAPNNIMLRNLDLVLESNRFKGSAVLDLTGKIPSIAAKINSGRVSLAPVTLEQVDPLKKIPDLGPLELAVKFEEMDNAPALSHLEFRLGSESTIFIQLRGTVGNLDPIGEVSLDFEFRSQDLALFNKAFGTGFIEGKPFHVAGRLDDPRIEKVTVTELEMTYGPSDLSGTAALDLTGDRPFLAARLSSNKLDLRPLIKEPDLTSPAPAPPPPPDPPKKRLFSRKPFDLTPLQRINAQVTFQGREVLFRRFAFNDLDIGLKLSEGDLYVDPLKVNIGGGKTEGTFALKSSSSPPFTAASLIIDYFDIGPMLKQLGQDSTLQGTLNASIYLDGRGESTADLMSALNGKVYLNIHDGQIESRQLALLERYLGSNILDVLNPFVKRPSHTTINCLLSTTSIKKGKVGLKLILDTDQTALATAGKIDLKTEALNIGIKPSPKKGFGDQHVGYVNFSLKELSQPFGLGGTLARPQLVLDPARTIVTAAKFAGATLLGPWGLTLFFTDISTGKKNICEEAFRVYLDQP